MILCVILIHCKNGIEYNEISARVWNFNYWLVLIQFINIPVDIFIFLAGYFTNIKICKYNDKYSFKRIAKLFIPFWC